MKYIKKLIIAIALLGMVGVSWGETLGPELVTNGNFSAWTGDDPNGWTVVGEVGADPEVSEVGSNEGHGGTSTGSCNIYTSAGADTNIYQSVLNADTLYKITLDITKSVTGAIKIHIGGTLVKTDMSAVDSYSYYGVSNSSNSRVQITRKEGAACDITFDDVSVKEVIYPTLYGVSTN